MVCCLFGAESSFCFIYLFRHSILLGYYYEQLHILWMITTILFYNDCLDECSLRYEVREQAYRQMRTETKRNEATAEMIEIQTGPQLVPELFPFQAIDSGSAVAGPGSYSSVIGS